MISTWWSLRFCNWNRRNGWCRALIFVRLRNCAVVHVAEILVNPTWRYYVASNTPKATPCSNSEPVRWLLFIKPRPCSWYGQVTYTLALPYLICVVILGYKFGLQVIRFLCVLLLFFPVECVSHLVILHHLIKKVVFHWCSWVLFIVLVLVSFHFWRHLWFCRLVLKVTVRLAEGLRLVDRPIT